MGGCSSGCRGKQVAGERGRVPRLEWDATDHFEQLEINGVPVQHFLRTICALSEGEAEVISDRLEEELVTTDGGSLVRSSPSSRATSVRSGKTGRHGSHHLRPSHRSSVSSLASSVSHSFTVSRSSTCAFASANGMFQERRARVEVFSWNVGSIADGRSSRGAGIEESAREAAMRVLSKALGAGRGERAEVIVVGLQEVISLTMDNAFGGVPRSTVDCLQNNGFPETVVQWVELIKDSINGTGSFSSSDSLTDTGRHTPGTQLYVAYGQPIYLFGMLLCVFCLPQLVGTCIHQFAMFEMPADKLNSGVKGVVACRFALYDRSFCFVNCHFHADTAQTAQGVQRDMEERIAQVHMCFNNIEFRMADQYLYPLWAHRAVFLMGDTNMRLSKPSEFASLEDFRTHVQDSIEDGSWASLAKYDQLTKMLKDPSSALARQSTRGDQNVPALAWQEPVFGQGGPQFKPTFKLSVPGPGYASKRVPAWTDRILFRSMDVRPMRYDAVSQEQILHPPRNITDHNPVYGLFEVICIKVNKGALHSHVRELVHGTPSGHKLDKVQQLLREQARHFRWRFVSTGRPHIERLAQRMFADLESELSGHELTAAADWLVEAQQECWRVVCEHLEEELVRMLRDCDDHELLEERLQNMARELRQHLENHISSPTSSRASGLLSLATFGRNFEDWALPGTATPTSLETSASRAARGSLPRGTTFTPLQLPHRTGSPQKKALKSAAGATSTKTEEVGSWWQRKVCCCFLGLRQKAKKKKTRIQQPPSSFWGLCWKEGGGTGEGCFSRFSPCPTSSSLKRRPRKG